MKSDIIEKSTKQELEEEEDKRKNLLNCLIDIEYHAKFVISQVTAELSKDSRMLRRLFNDGNITTSEFNILAEKIIKKDDKYNKNKVTHDINILKRKYMWGG